MGFILAYYTHLAICWDWCLCDCLVDLCVSDAHFLCVQVFSQFPDMILIYIVYQHHPKAKLFCHFAVYTSRYSQLT